MKNKFNTTTNLVGIAILFLFLCFSPHANAATFTAVTSGNWNAPATWGLSSGGAGVGYPGSGDAVVIDGNGNLPVTDYTVTVNITGAKCASIQLGTANRGSGTLTFSGTSDLTVSGTVSIGATSTSLFPDAGTVTMTSNGTFTVGSISIAPNSAHNGTITLVSGSTIADQGNLTGGAGTQAISMTGGTFTVAGTIDNGTGAQTITMSGGSLSAFVFPSVSSGTTYNLTGGTIIYTGTSAANIIVPSAYYNLSVTLTSVSGKLQGDIIVNGTLSYLSGTLDANGHNMTVKGNIVIGGTFIPGAGTVTVSGSSGQTIAGVFSNLTIDNTSGGITLSANVTVSGTLTMTSGNINTAGYNVTLGTGGGGNIGTLTHTAGFFTGTGSFSRWFATSTFAIPSTSGLFPMGTSSSNARNLWIAPSSAPGTAGIITVTHTDGANKTSMTSYTDGTLTGVDVHQNTSWAISSATLAGGTYSIRIEGQGVGVVSNAAQLTISNATGNPGGTYSASSGTTGDPVTNRTGMTLAQLGQTLFIAGNHSVNALPVTLVSFNANYENNIVNLNWATASEINNHYFNIERSVDGETWANIIGQVQGHGNSFVTQNYCATDNLAGVVPAGDIYYRLEQVDFNGESAYSMIRSVSINHIPAMTVTAYPNPSHNTINVSWMNEDNSNAVLKLVNITGTTIYTESITGIGMMHKQIDMSTYPTGTYFIQVATYKNLSTQTVIKE